MFQYTCILRCINSAWKCCKDLYNTNQKTVQGSSCCQCWQAPRQLGTTGHKSLHNLNMWVWRCSRAAPQHLLGCIILKRSSVLSLCSPLIVLKLSPTAVPTLSHPPFFVHPTSQHLQPSQPLNSQTTVLLTTTDSQNIAFMGNLLWDHCTLASLTLSFLHFKTSLIHCWCAIQDSCWSSLLFLLPLSLLYNSGQ